MEESKYLGKIHREASSNTQVKGKTTTVDVVACLKQPLKTGDK